MNLIELLESSKQLAGWRGVGYGQNTNWILKSAIPFVGMKTLLFQAECYGQTVAATHVINIQFSNIKYFDEPPENGDVKKLEYNGNTYYFIRPTLESQVTVRCSCADYTFRFAWYNGKHKALFGAMPKKYKRKTKTRPSVNPLHLPGICKHIFQTQSLLHFQDFIG